MSKGTYNKIADLVSQRKISDHVENGKKYKLLGVRWYAKGPFIREIVDTSNSKATRLFPVKVGDFIYNRLFAWKGSFGLISEKESGCHVSGEFPLFECNPAKLLPEYLFLYMSQPNIWKQIEIESTGSTTISRNRWKESNFLQLKINIFPVNEQKRIVDLISSVDSYIEAIQRNLESAKRLRNATVHELLNASGDDWHETSLGQIFTLEYGKPLTEENRDGKGFPVFASAGIVGLHSDPLVLQAPVIVVGRKGTAGAVYWSETPCFVIDTAYFVKPIEDTDLRFLYLLLNFVDLKSVTAQTGVPGLNRDRAYSLKINLPPKAVQLGIVEIISTMDQVIDRAESVALEATNLRSGLLSALLCGDHLIPASYDKVMGAA